jgi:serine/threonine protein phosphatase PrpC
MHGIEQTYMLLDVGRVEDQGERSYMEDRSQVLLRNVPLSVAAASASDLTTWRSSASVLFIGVYDGHAGSSVSEVSISPKQ